MIRTVRILTFHTFQEHWRNRSFLVVLLFSGLLIYMSLLLGTLAVDQELRVLLDFGLSVIELMSLGIAVYGAASGILREMESKTIYLILARPVSRLHFLLGRYFGLLFSSGCALIVMAAIHLSLMGIKGWSWEAGYLLAIFGIFLKLAIATALTMFMALVSTSVLSALSITAIAWTVGHFIPEIGLMIRTSPHAASAFLLQTVTYLIPNLQILNFRDRLDVPPVLIPHGMVAVAIAYTVIYSGACLAMAYGLFRNKEF